MRVLLDSTVLIDVLRGRPAADRVGALEPSFDTPCTTGLNVEQVVRGMKLAELESVRRLFDGLEILPIGASEGWLAGSWRRDYQTRGITLSQADCLIAATACLGGARLATGNPDDFPMTELAVEHWPVGE